MSKIREHLFSALSEQTQELRFGGVVMAYREYDGFCPGADVHKIGEALNDLVASGDVILRKEPPKEIGFILKLYSVRRE